MKPRQALLFLALILSQAETTQADRRPANLIPNGDFQQGETGGLPTGWTIESARPSLSPIFTLEETGRGRLLMATLDMNCSPSPAYNGGTMYSAPGGRRNRRDQKVYLEDQIREERARWWVQ